MIGTPPSKRSLWHDPAEHARDFAERYAEPMNYHVENRIMELGIPTDRIGAEILRRHASCSLIVPMG